MECEEEEVGEETLVGEEEEARASGFEEGRMVSDSWRRGERLQRPGLKGWGFGWGGGRWRGGVGEEGGWGEGGANAV